MDQLANEQKNHTRIGIKVVLILVILGVVFGLLKFFCKPSKSPSTNSYALSRFLPHAGGCLWERLELQGSKGTNIVVGKETGIATFHSDCNRPRVSLNRTNTRAAVWFGDGNDDPLAWLTSLSSKRPQRIQLPPGELQELLFDDEDLLNAIVKVPSMVSVNSSGQKQIVFEDKTLDFDQSIDSPGLLHCYRRESGAWTLRSFEVVADGERGGFTIATPPQPSSFASRNLPGLEEVTDHLLLTQLDPIVPSYRRQNHSWVRIVSGQESKKSLVFLASKDKSEFYGQAVLQTGDHISELKQWPFKANNRLNLESWDNLLLLQDHTLIHALLLNLENGQIILQSAESFSTSFWPDPTL